MIHLIIRCHHPVVALGKWHQFLSQLALMLVQQHHLIPAVAAQLLLL
jgi:phage/plasmid primase-like uncharacterized protein